MANSYFQFKQFTIQQEHCAMKVCTDACLLGAYTAENLPPGILEILDIGTGTGLLPLMLAQKTNANIDAIEINEDAANQARENAESSPWKNKISILNASLQQFKTLKKYDLIISNPPFFENDLKSASKEKNDAKHDSSLTLQELAGHIKEHLATGGFAAILLPYSRTHYFKQLSMEAGLAVSHILKIKQTPAHDFFRSVVFATHHHATYSEREMVIYQQEKQYSAEFLSLLKDYYLNL